METFSAHSVEATTWSHWSNPTSYFSVWKLKSTLKIKGTHFAERNNLDKILIWLFHYVFHFSSFGCHYDCGLVHSYGDIFTSTTFSVRFWKSFQGVGFLKNSTLLCEFLGVEAACPFSFRRHLLCLFIQPHLHDVTKIVLVFTF